MGSELGLGTCRFSLKSYALQYQLHIMELFKCPAPDPNVLTLPSQFPFVVLVALLMSWQMWATGLQISGLRRKIFNEEFMKKHWGQVHKREIGEEIQIGGSPDTGSGIYAHRLGYGDWYKFNVFQRLHLNYVEGINLAQGTLLAAGLYQPRAAAILGLIYIAAKFLFAYGYKSKLGALSKARIIGVALCYTTSLINTGIFAYNLLQKFRN